MIKKSHAWILLALFSVPLLIGPGACGLLDADTEIKAEVNPHVETDAEIEARVEAEVRAKVAAEANVSKTSAAPTSQSAIATSGPATNANNTSPNTLTGGLNFNWAPYVVGGGGGALMLWLMFTYRNRRLDSSDDRILYQGIFQQFERCQDTINKLIEKLGNNKDERKSSN